MESLIIIFPALVGTLATIAALSVIGCYLNRKFYSYRATKLELKEASYIRRIEEYNYGESASGDSSSSVSASISTSDSESRNNSETYVENATAMYQVSSGFVSFDNRFNTTPHLSAGPINVPEVKAEEQSSLSKPKIAKLTRRMDAKEEK